MGAWYRSSVSEFLKTDVELVVSQLAYRQLHRGFKSTREQATAWVESVGLLQSSLRESVSALGEPTVSLWGICLEYEIPRRLLRPDAVLLLGAAVVPVEFKTGQSGFDRSSRMQVAEYARDLRDFHKESGDSPVIPVLVASGQAKGDWDLNADDLLDNAQCAGADNLSELVNEIWNRFGVTGKLNQINRWVDSNYQPTPGILETASDLFAGHQVREISHSYADNLTRTVDVLREEIGEARRTSSRRVLFVTGVPGSGKTLTGLTAIHESAAGISSDPLGIYLSGNGPLIEVLQYSIARDMNKRTGLRMKEARRQSRTLIQPVHPFVLLHGNDSMNVPPEHVVVFDEAQRAWDAKQLMKKWSVLGSEAEITLDAMARVDDWSVVIALVGEGQEINDGEAGISSWTEALRARPEWAVVAPPDLDAPGIEGIRRDPALHLSVSVRSPRSMMVSHWIEAVLAGEAGVAAKVADKASGFPIVLSRDLGVVREYLRDRARIDRRVGLVASSQARRLRAFGLEMNRGFHGDLNWPYWFVHPASDVRSSYSLEVAASEFKCQGLELDWTGLCWGGDFLRGEVDGHWTMRRLRGDKWTVDGKRDLVLNRYRVLLSRARLGMAIWVPKPDSTVPLYRPGEFDATAEFLLECGAESLDGS